VYPKVSLNHPLPNNGQLFRNNQQVHFYVLVYSFKRPGSSVGIATGYGLDGPVSNLGRGEIFRTCPDRPWDPPSLLCNGYRVFPGCKERPGREADPSPLLVPWSRKSRAIPLLPVWAVRRAQSLSACTRVTFTLLLIPIQSLTYSQARQKMKCMISVCKKGNVRH